AQVGEHPGALIINLVRSGERRGYQKVIDGCFAETGLAFADPEGVKPPDKAAFNRARKKIPVEVFQMLPEIISAKENNK
ncbi:MAG: hypothetical protein JRG72_11705, partial [Deltaproteobacteria bacterium]|nr:hypothetical protein [Deltaproteobacteria bacterium]